MKKCVICNSKRIKQNKDNSKCMKCGFVNRKLSTIIYDEGTKISKEVWTSKKHQGIKN